MDPSRDSAIVRYTKYGNDRPHSDLEVEYEQAAGTWLPLSWTYRHYDTGHAKMVLLTRAKVEERQLDPKITDEDFAIPQRPGMLVSKVTRHGKDTEGKVIEPTTRYFRAGEEGMQEVIFDGAAERLAPRPWRWAALLVLPLELVIWILFRRRVRRKLDAGGGAVGHLPT